jgi:hypothetical protein
MDFATARETVTKLGFKPCLPDACPFPVSQSQGLANRHFYWRDVKEIGTCVVDLLEPPTEQSGNEADIDRLAAWNMNQVKRAEEFDSMCVLLSVCC